MITKDELLNYATSKFTKLGSKHVTLDELANDLGISKKTIYTFFKTKEDLVVASITCLLDAYAEDINRLINSNGKDPILCVILIYQRGFEYLKYFKPSFLFGLEKYYPKAFQLFNDFIKDLANNRISPLLKEAQKNGNIKPDVNIDLLITIYFFRVDNLLFKDNNLFESYSKETLLKHFIVFNLSGVITNNYSNEFIEV